MEKMTIKFYYLLNMISANVDIANVQAIKEGSFDEQPNTVFKVKLCLSCEEKTHFTVNIDNPLLSGLYDLEVYGICPDDEPDTLQVWFTAKSVMEMLKKVYKE